MVKNRLLGIPPDPEDSLRSTLFVTLTTLPWWALRQSIQITADQLSGTVSARCPDNQVLVSRSAAAPADVPSYPPERPGSPGSSTYPISFAMISPNGSSTSANAWACWEPPSRMKLARRWSTPSRWPALMSRQNTFGRADRLVVGIGQAGEQLHFHGGLDFRVYLDGFPSWPGTESPGRPAPGAPRPPAHHRPAPVLIGALSQSSLGFRLLFPAAAVP